MEALHLPGKAATGAYGKAVTLQSRSCTGSASFAESLYGLRRVPVNDKDADASGGARRPLSRPKMRITLLLLVSKFPNPRRA